MTYSIAAHDAETGELGVGVATHQPCVGAIVPWVEPGVGAVATQSFVNPSFGPQALALLRHGLDAPRALAAVLAADDRPEVRQVAIVDATGKSAVHTGEACIPYAGHRTGPGFSVQANMMLRPTVPDAMAEAFAAAQGPLALRILAALEAAEAEGGDIRGRQSAAIVVRRTASASDYRWNLRVDNDPEPLAKLRELAAIRLAGALEEEFEEAQSGSPEERLARARAAYAEARAIHPSDEQSFWYAVMALAPLGAEEEAAAVLAPLFERAPHWRELLHRLSFGGLEGLKARFPRDR
ncbi:hypothetical protein HRbin29_02201 [bacterium HR29]|nr:hypothetical protein HRbin29_02201 [bacterium HR29]